MFKFIIFFLLISTIIFGNQITNYDYKYKNNKLILSFNLEKENKPEIYNLDNPFRIMINFKDMALNKKISKELEVDDGFIKNIFLVSFKRNNVPYVKSIIHFLEKKEYKTEIKNNKVFIIIDDVLPPQKINDEIAQEIEKATLKNNNEVKENKIKKEIRVENITNKIRKGNYLNSYKYIYDNNDILFTFSLNKEIKPKIVILDKPFRVMLDFKEISIDNNFLKTNNIDNNEISKILTIPFSKNGIKYVRVMIEFKTSPKNIISNYINKKLILTIKNIKNDKKVAKKVAKKLVITKTPKKHGNILESYVYTYQNDNLILSFKLTKVVNPKVISLKKPFRIIMDFKNVGISNDIIKTNNIDDNIIEKILIIPFMRNGIKQLRVMIQLKEDKEFDVERFEKNFLLTIKNVKKENKTELSIKDKNSYQLVKLDSENLKEDNKIVEKDIAKKKAKIKLDIPKNYKHQLNEEAPILVSEKVIKYKKTKLIKLGFKKYKDKTRVIINTKDPLQYEIEKEDKKLIITLKKCRLGQRIAKLTLDTSYFGSVVKKIKPKIESNDEIIVEVTLGKNIDLPIFTQNENNIYIDFKEE